MVVGNKVVMETVGIAVVGSCVVGGCVVRGAAVRGGGVEGGGEVVVISAVPVDRYVALKPCSCVIPSVVNSTVITPPLEIYSLLPALSSPDRVAITSPHAQEKPSHILTTSCLVSVKNELKFNCTV